MKQIFILILTFSALTACTESNTDSTSTAAPPPPQVEVASPLHHKLTDWDDFTGRFEAIDSVNVRARVTGYLVEKKFKDGQIVKKGQVLYVIDPRPFDYELYRIEAQYNLAKTELERAHKLRQTSAISQEEVDRRFQELQITEASLNNAKLEKSFTQIKSPIDGKISDSFVDVGNMVQENQTILTRIVSTNPMHFRFEGSQSQLLKYIRLDLAGERPSSNRAPNPIFIKLMDEDKYYHQGKMHFVDNVVDTQTGTIQGTAVVSNDQGLLYPGLFGQARLIGRAEYDALLLPEQAINTDQNKKFVYVVNADNQVERRYVNVGTLLDNGLLVIDDGLSAEDRVVITGKQRIRAPMQLVTPVETPLTWTPIETLVYTPETPSSQVEE